MNFLDSAKLSKKQSHRGRNDSGELDVFEAARYFSAAAAEERTQVAVYNKYGLVSQKAMKEGSWSGARRSLDLPMENIPIPPHCHRLEKQIKEKKPKHPSSPSSKLASFLNSLFTQTAKKKAKSAPQSTKAEDESPGWRRRRRRSISQTHDISNTNVKSVYSSSSSGFRTPPPHSSTKIYKELSSFTDLKQVESLQNCNGQARYVNLCPKNVDLLEKKHTNMALLDQKFRFNDGFLEKEGVYANGFLEKDGNYRNWVLEKDGSCRNGVVEKDRIWVDEFSGEKSFGKDQEMDDGGESDSSSDLFELQNYDLGVYSNGLPVYETTHLESIKRGPAIISGSA